jgi:hypothetical protein
MLHGPSQLAPERDTAHSVPIEDLNTRRELWHGVWEWIIGECERLASESELRHQPPSAEVPDHAHPLVRRRL